MVKREVRDNYKDFKCNCNHKSKHAGSAVYGLGFIGAAIYYISIAPNAWMAFVGFLKAIIWPVFLVFDALKFLAIH